MTGASLPITQPMSQRLSRWFRLSVYLLFSGVLVIWLLLQSNHLVAPEKTYQVTEIETVALPPPPPPPKVNQNNNSQSQDLAPSLSVSKSTAPVSIATQPLSVSMTAGMGKIKGINEYAFTLKDETSSEFMDLFSQTIPLPRLRYMPRVQLPYIVDNGRPVQAAEALVLVHIDKQGRLELLKILKMDYPQIEPAVTQIVKRAKFYPAEKDGVIMEGDFMWPIILKK